jgi:hypothetical protein
MAVKNQSGQILVEAVLLLVVFVSVMLLVTGQLKKMDYISGLTLSPWEKVSGMVECGVWAACGVQASGKGLHPGNRVVSFDPGKGGYE